MKPVRQMKISRGMSVNDLVREFDRSGVFQAGNLAKAVDIYEEMLKKKASVILAFAGALVPGGLRRVISDLVKDGMVNLVVTTGANVTHDIASSFGEDYFKVTEFKDLEMRKKGVSRIYDIGSPDKSAVKFEKEIQKILRNIPEGTYSTPELLKEIGKKIKDSNSMIKQTSSKNIPLFVPALEDSILGIQIWIHSQDRKIKLDPLKDIKQMLDWVYENKNRGVIVLGGGVPKNWALQSGLIPGPHRYGIQITTDVPQFGGASGASLNEAISWGKFDAKSKLITVYSDSTIAFPLMVAAVRERISSKASR